MLFSPRTEAPRRRVYAAATVYFVAVFVAMMWPVYPLFSRIRPFVLGLPLSLLYIVTLLSVSFFVLLGLYLWESRRGLLDRDREEPAAGARATEPDRTARTDGQAAGGGRQAEG